MIPVPDRRGNVQTVLKKERPLRGRSVGRSVSVTPLLPLEAKSRSTNPHGRLEFRPELSRRPAIVGIGIGIGIGIDTCIDTCIGIGIGIGIGIDTLH